VNTEQPVERQVGCLADQVPKGDIDRTPGRAHDTGTIGQIRGIECLLADAGDEMRILAQ
jgi:hypothetical protein